MQQTFSCPKCGFPVVLGSVFCGNCGNSLSWQQQTTPQPIYQQPVNYQSQSPSFYQKPANDQPQQGMNWFQRHLNWTFVFSTFPWCVLGIMTFFISMWISIVNINNDPLVIMLRIACFIPMLIIGGWVIKKKGRSLWWILLIGWLSPLWLGNKNR